MSLESIFRDKRQAAGISQVKLSIILKCNHMTVSKSEQPYSKTGQLPTNDYIHKFAAHFGESPQDRLDLERRLLVERYLLALPPLVSELLESSLNERGTTYSSGMPSAFSKMVEKDWKAAGQIKLKKFSQEDLASIINGSRLLSRDEVIALATTLKQDTEKYLFVAEYMTASIMTLCHTIGILEKEGANKKTPTPS